MKIVQPHTLCNIGTKSHSPKNFYQQLQPVDTNAVPLKINTVVRDFGLDNTVDKQDALLICFINLTGIYAFECRNHWEGISYVLNGVHTIFTMLSTDRRVTDMNEHFRGVLDCQSR